MIWGKRWRRPVFVRGLARRKVEQWVGNRGGRRVPLADFWARTKNEEIYSELFRASKNKYLDI